MFTDMNLIINIFAGDVIGFASILQMSLSQCTKCYKLRRCYNIQELWAQPWAFAQGNYSPTLNNEVIAMSIYDSLFIF